MTHEREIYFLLSGLTVVIIIKKLTLQINIYFKSKIQRMFVCTIY